MTDREIWVSLDVRFVPVQVKFLKEVDRVQFSETYIMCMYHHEWILSE